MADIAFFEEPTVFPGHIDVVFLDQFRERTVKILIGSYLILEVGRLIQNYKN